MSTVTQVDTARSAAAQGYRMPAEWEALEGVWLVRPHNEETWPLCLTAAQREWDDWREKLERVVMVRETSALGIPTNDSWIRDFGPVFVRTVLGSVAAHSFRFNGWGNKYEARTLDDAVPEGIQALTGLPMWRHDAFVLEGGSIDSNGAGSLLTTTQCLENDNRNPEAATDRIVNHLRDCLGITNIIWLPGGIKGDDTDGHIDDIARFVRRDCIAALRAPESHPDHEVLERNWQVLVAARDEGGRPFQLVALPVPEPIYYQFPADRFGPGGRMMLPASHANFLIANGIVFVPVFGGPSDDVACDALGMAMPGFRIEPIMARHLVVGLGSLHCLSCHQPAEAAAVAQR